MTSIHLPPGRVVRNADDGEGIARDWAWYGDVYLRPVNSETLRLWREHISHTRKPDMAQQNPEQKVLDEIDELIKRGDHYDKWGLDDPKCPVCEGDWHGLPKDGWCPGPYSTAQEQRAWKDGREAQKKSVVTGTRKVSSGGRGSGDRLTAEDVAAVYGIDPAALGSVEMTAYTWLAEDDDDDLIVHNLD